MRRILLSLLCAALLASLCRAEEALWLRYPAISPDGASIAFSYRGDIWRVPSAGGEARVVTTHVGYERSPVWSPDGQWLAFASDRHGNFDVFVVPARGGAEKRLTFDSAGDVPTCFSHDGKRVFFRSRRQDAPEACVGSVWAEELYSVSVDGGRAWLELTTPAEAAQVSPDGARIAYQDGRGWENRFRKHHVSPVTKDIAVFDVETKKHRRLTKWGGEDRNPVWSADGKSLAFLSERGGNYNVWRIAEPWTAPPEQVTRHPVHPVRNLSASRDGTLCYAYTGGIYRKPPQAEPVRVSVSVHAGAKQNDTRAETLPRGATGFAVSPGEDEVAFVVRGEVFVASVKHGTTRRITETPGQERSVTWAKDGRALYYAAERDGSWNLYRTELVRKEEEFFFLATLLKEEPVLVGPDETFQPLMAPDGKSLAYLHNRDEIKILDLATRQTRRALPPERNYSYSDGDLDFQWSPDSQWLAAVYLPEKSWIENVVIIHAATGRAENMTLSGYYDWKPKWSPDGKALLFLSNRHGRRNHGSWGADSDVLAVYLTREALRIAEMTEEEYELHKKAVDETEKEKKEKKKEGKKEEGKKEEGAGEEQKGDKDKDEEEEKAPDPVVIEFAGHENRLKRITLHSAPVESYAMSPDGDKLAYFAQVGGKWDVWLHEIRKAETRRLFEAGDDSGGDVVFSKDGEAVFVRRANGAILRVPLDGKPKGVDYAAEMTIDGPRERAYIFDHVWRQTLEKFYDEKLHGVDWAAMRDHYAPFLPHIDNNHDFADLLSEMVGELNASHTGSRYRIPQEGADQTACLGLLFDPRHAGAGLKIAEVLEQGPMDRPGEAIPAGTLLTRIDGVALEPGVNVSALLNRKAGKRTLLEFAAPGGKTSFRVMKPVKRRDEFELRYLRWRKQRRELTDRLSKGRLGYVHVRGMDDGSFRHVFKEALGRHAAKEGLVVDTRFNGGGWLHDDLLKFLSGRRYLTFRPRGKQAGSFGGEPLHRWGRPSIVVMSESNYSDAHVFPYAYQALKMGKLVGAPVAGTGTAVWWERQIDPSVSYGIPQIGMITPGGDVLENSTLQPDVLVLTDPEAMARGDDPQLEKAVSELLAGLK